MAAQPGASRGQAGPFGIALDRAALGLAGRCLDSQALALRQRLGMRDHAPRCLQACRPGAQQVVPYQQADLPTIWHRRVQEHVERGA